MPFSTNADKSCRLQIGAVEFLYVYLFQIIVDVNLVQVVPALEKEPTMLDAFSSSLHAFVGNRLSVQFL